MPCYAYLHVIHDNVLVPGPTQCTAIMAELKETLLLRSLCRWLTLQSDHISVVYGHYAELEQSLLLRDLF